MFIKKMTSYTALLHLILFSVFALPLFAQANLTASVDRDTVSISETLTLTVSTDGQTKDSPDFSSLRNDFDVLSTQRSSSIQVINGSAESSTDWQITLAPKRAGKLLIPSFNLDSAVSDAIEITVSSQTQQQSATDDDAQVRATLQLDKNSAYVQEQVIATVKLITEINLSQAELEPLELKNALVVNLDQHQYQTTINGTPHLIVETTLAIFPQENGGLTIPSLTYTVNIDNPRNIWGNTFGRNRNNILRLKTEEQHITVKPVPTLSTSKNWLPADNLTLHETWSGSLEHLKVGEPVTRTITVNADALTAGQIAPIQYEPIEGLTFYPDQAQTKDNKTAKGVKGTRIETTAIVPNRGGDFTLPEVKVDWWNTKTQQMETATLPAKTMHVVGDPSAVTQAPAPLPKANSSRPDENQTPTITLGDQQNIIPVWIWLIMALLTLLTLGFAFYSWKLKTAIGRMTVEQDERDILLREKEKDIWDSLKTAAANKDATALRKAVINWAQFHWPAQKINTLEDVSNAGDKEALSKELQELDRILYSNHANESWDAGHLLKILNEFRKQKHSGRKEPRLQSLYAE